MNKLFSIFLFLSVYCVSSCRHQITSVDKCKDIACQNGGTCTNDACTCLNGYSGDLCQIALPGVVKGWVSPVAVVTGIVLTPTNGTNPYRINTLNGAVFTFPEVKPGSYTLHINTNSPYWPSPPDINIIVNAGDTIDLGRNQITYNAAAQTGTVTFSIDGGSTHTFDYNNFRAGSMLYWGIYLSGSEPDYPKYSFTLNIVHVTGPGIYTITNASYLELYHYAPSNSLDGHWRTTDFSSDVIANVTSYDTVAKKFSGTFNGILKPKSSDYDTIQISGAFIDVYGN